MKPAAFEYVAPTSLDEAVAALAEHGEDAKVLAGGQSLLPLLRLRLAYPSVLVDLGGIPELRGVRDEGDRLVVGAMTTHHDVMTDALVKEHAGLVAAATAIRVVIPTRIQSPIPVFQCTGLICNLEPISLGVDTPIYLTFYGTGIRGRSSLANVKVTIGTVEVAPTYAGPQPQTAGLDQVNVPLPLSLRGVGEVNVSVTVDGLKSNLVKINVQ